MDQAVGMMAEMAFATIDNIFTQSPNAPRVMNLSAEYAVEVVWDGETNSWIGTLQFDDGNGMTFSATNAVQFLQGTTPVQYPDEQLLTEVTCNVSLEATGENASFTATQNMSFKPGANNIITLNGNGAFDTNVTAEVVTETGTTSCTFQSHFTTTISNVIILDSETASTDCPTGGSVRFSGQMTTECTGETPISGTRSWSVTRRWDETGASTTDFISGGNIWTFEEACA
jgi:hypothetical protein